MKGIVALLVMFVMVSSVIATNIVKIEEEEDNIIMLEKEFDVRTYSSNGRNMLMADGCSYLISYNKPVMPFYTKLYFFPFGTKVNIDVKVEGIENMGKLNISSASPVFPLHPRMAGKYEENMIYPCRWYKWHSYGGIVNGERKTIAKIILYPARYMNGSIFTAKKFVIKIGYDIEERDTISNYDMLIISPSKFIEYANQLAEFKEGQGIKTKVVDIASILSMNGRDEAEKVKYYIKNAIEQDGIKYILLFGGRKPGVKEEWWVPVRYANVVWPEENPYLERSYVTDLYFADIYDGNGSFSSWDTNNNGIYAEWPKNMKRIDDMDLYPDVYIGRLACRNKIEAKIMVEKIIEYETGNVEKKVVGVGGDNFDDEGLGYDTDYYEGEAVTKKMLSYFENMSFKTERVWASEENVDANTIKEAIGNGAMFVHLHGHGSPIYWSTHKPHDFDNWQKGLSIFDAPFFFNDGLSVMVFGGCHTAMFNVSMTIHAWTGGLPAPEGISWWFARKYGGGAIASFGYSCFPVAYVGENGDIDGDGVNEPDCVEGGYGYMELGLFEGYSKGIKKLGELWGYTEERYLNTFDVIEERWEIHTVHGFTLLGDPTLSVGGRE